MTVSKLLHVEDMRYAPTIIIDNTDLMWYLLTSSVSASTTQIIQFLGCNNTQVLQQYNEKLGHGH